MTNEIFNQKYEEYYGKVFGFLLKRTNAFGDANLHDLVQDTFVKAFINKDSLNEEEVFNTWICNIAKNVVIDRYRKQKHEKEAVENFYFWLKTEDTSYLSDLDTIIQTLKTLEISNFNKQILWLYLVEDMEYQAIAKYLKLNIGTVASKIFYGKKVLSEKLNEEGIYYGKSRKGNEEENLGETEFKYLDAN